MDWLPPFTYASPWLLLAFVLMTGCTSPPTPDTLVHDAAADATNATDIQNVGDALEDTGDDGLTPLPDIAPDSDDILPDTTSSDADGEWIEDIPDATVDDIPEEITSPDTETPDVVDPPDEPTLAPERGARGDTVVLRIAGIEVSQINGIALFDGKLDNIKSLGDLDSSWWQSETQRLFVPLPIPADLDVGDYTIAIALEEISLSFPFFVDLAEGEMMIAAGTGDLGKTMEPSPPLEAEFFLPIGVEVGDETLFFTDAGWNAIYAMRIANTPKPIYGGTITLTPDVVVRIAGTGGFGVSENGPALLVPLSEPKGLCHHQTAERELLFFADTTHHQIRVINLGDTTTTEMGHSVEPGHIVTLAGLPNYGYGGDGGPALDATFFRPWRVRGCNGPLLFTGDVENYRLRAINRTDQPINVVGLTIEAGHVDTIAGTGVIGFSGDGGAATNAQISIVKGFALTEENLLLFSDPENDRIRVINLTDSPEEVGLITVEGQQIDTLGEPGNFNGLVVTPGYNHPTGIRLDEMGNLIIADTYSQTLKLHNLTHGPVHRGNQLIFPEAHPTALAGLEHYKGGNLETGPGLDQLMADPFDIALDPLRGDAYITDVENHVVRRFKLHRPHQVFSGSLGPFPALPASTVSAPHILDTDTGILTLADGTTLPLATGRIFNFTQITIPEYAALRITGSRPAAFLATEGILIAGFLLVESGPLLVGPGVGSGSAGGGHGTPGESGEAGTPGQAYGDPTLIPLTAGSGGGGGSLGGGALLLAALGDVVISGVARADGETNEEGGGGGGGAIRIVSFGQVQITGTLSAQGGEGKAKGGEGRLRIESATDPILDGAITPAATLQTIEGETPLPGF